MASAKIIAQEIITRVEAPKFVDFSAWHIGITQTPQARKVHLNNPRYWKIWIADSLADAQAVESYFVHTKKMRTEKGEEVSPGLDTFVYLY